MHVVTWFILFFAFQCMLSPAIFPLPNKYDKIDPKFTVSCFPNRMSCDDQSGSLHPSEARLRRGKRSANLFYIDRAISETTRHWGAKIQEFFWEDCEQRPTCIHCWICQLFHTCDRNIKVGMNGIELKLNKIMYVTFWLWGLRPEDLSTAPLIPISNAYYLHPGDSLWP